ncbi:hypothetical protein BP5796_07606 [Coleophoma crateriformis]|uniref:Uncharacterized protein n=1 Tax=Coleophoma crateriformis TaxID=565419 RepID=A0A3D8RJT7_9HELO|nr:hypothetical protein BP5796_07606 [Coleophoma crateriformis]
MDRTAQQEHAENAQSVAHQAAHTIEVGEDVDPSDDGYATDDASRASTSVSSSVRDYSFENGRRYHAFREGTYLFPNDESEQEREDMKHAMVVNLCGGALHYAPLENPQKVIDIGTGTGICAVDMGDEYPEATVLGIDLSPIQPSWVPPNVKFMVDDAESRWLHPENHFDFVHVRNLASSIKDFPKLISAAYAHLKPRGWIELQDLYFKVECDDGSMPEDYVLAKWLDNMEHGLKNFGVDLLGPRKHPAYVEEAGFVNVQQKILKVPIGIWPKNKTLKTVGLYNRTMIIDGLQGNSMKVFTKGLGWSVQEVEIFNMEVRKAVMDSSIHSHLTFNVLYGQKPPENTA